MAIDESLLDKRIVTRHLDSGKIPRAEYQALLDALPDLSDQVYRPGEGGAGAEADQSDG